MEEKKYRPFSNGSQYEDWSEANCYRCKKYDGENLGKCQIFDGLFDACFGDGNVSEDIAKRMGFLEHRGEYCWPCNEVDWTEEWKQTVLNRKKT